MGVALTQPLGSSSGGAHDVRSNFPGRAPRLAWRVVGSPRSRCCTMPPTRKACRCLLRWPCRGAGFQTEMSIWAFPLANRALLVGDMVKDSSPEPDALGRGAYSAVESLRLLNFNRPGLPPARRVSRNTVARWLRGYSHGEDGSRHSEALWEPDYHNEGDQIELSFRDLIELRFVKTFRDLGIGLPTIRDCYRRAVDEVQDDRPFSTQRFRTDGKTIFLEITEKDHDGRMIDLKRRQQVFRTIIEPSSPRPRI